MKLRKQKSVNLTEKGWFIYLFSALVIGTSLFDLITFLYSSTKAFEINPVYIFTGSVALMVGLKLLVTFGLVYILIKKPNMEWVQFLFISLATYLILLQIAGGISNLTIHAAQPPESAILPVQEAVSTYNWTVVLQLYAPVIMSTLIFLFWKWSYPRKDDEQFSDGE